MSGEFMAYYRSEEGIRKTKQIICVISLIGLILISSLIGACAHFSCFHPLDGKASSWCRREKAAEAFCEHGPGKVKDFDYYKVECE